MINEWLKLDSSATDTVIPFFSAQWKNATVQPADMPGSMIAAQWISSKDPSASYDCANVLFNTMGVISIQENPGNYGSQFKDLLALVHSLDESSFARLIETTMNSDGFRLFWLTLFVNEKQGPSAAELRAKIVSLLRERAQFDVQTLDFDLHWIIVWTGNTVDSSLVPLVIKALNSKPLNSQLGEVLQAATIDKSILPTLEDKLSLNIDDGILKPTSTSYEQITFIKMFGAFGQGIASDARFLTPYLATSDDAVASAAEDSLVRLGPTIYSDVFTSPFLASKKRELGRAFLKRLKVVATRVPPNPSIILETLRTKSYSYPSVFTGLLLCSGTPTQLNEAAQILLRDSKGLQGNDSSASNYVWAFGSLGKAGTPGLEWMRGLSTNDESTIDSDDVKEAIRDISHDKKGSCLTNSEGLGFVP